MSDDTYTYRRIGGKRYGIFAVRPTRALAVKEAKKARGLGYLARMIKLPGVDKKGRKGIVWVYTAHPEA